MCSSSATATPVRPRLSLVSPSQQLDPRDTSGDLIEGRAHLGRSGGHAEDVLDHPKQFLAERTVPDGNAAFFIRASRASGLVGRAVSWE